MTDESPAFRRSAFAALCLAIAALLLWLTWGALAPGGVGAAEALILLCVLLTTPWAALSAGNSLVGLAILLLSRDPPAAVLPVLRRARPGGPRATTALVVCIRNEDMATVTPPLARLLDGLEAAGAGSCFRLWLLSDTVEAGAAATEEAAVAELTAARAGRLPSIHYRRRTRNTGFKAGNVMDWLDHHAGDAEFFITLDADSVMTPGAVLRLVAVMEAEPRLAIVQQLIVGRPASAAFPRLFQFGMRAGMRAWATGQAWWQLDAGPYWGHNAIIRAEPFRQHARLEPLPDGRAILSHDMVESVRLQAAGWHVRCLPVEEGSLEANPPAMPEFLRRDERWGAGNMQYWQLLRLPNFTAMGRLQLLQAILLFLGAPLYAAILLLSAVNVAAGGGEGTPMGALAVAVLAHWLCYFAPKLSGYAQVLAQGRAAARYGGRAAFARGAAAEIAFISLFEPLSTLNKAMFLATLPFGRRTGWTPQNRADRGIAWRDAARLLWPHSAIGVGLTALFASVSLPALLLALPFTLGMVLAIPLCVWSADPAVSAWLRQRGIAATPEELSAARTPVREGATA